MKTVNPNFKIPEFLYHGTNEFAAKSALVEGLKPRARMDNHSGNWEHTVSSHPECVYITDIYAPYFAGTASYTDSKWGLVEIDVSKLKKRLFRPDEDCLEQGTRNIKDRFDGGKLDVMERTAHFRDNIDRHYDAWVTTLEAMGTCSYKGIIPPEAITRICIYDWKKNGTITLAAYDASITIPNHRYCYDRHKSLTRWMFGETVTAGEFYSEGWMTMLPADHIEKMNEILNEQKSRQIIVNEKYKK